MPIPGSGRRLGFSAVELLVVVLVVSILIAVLLPAVRRSMRHASATVCLHNLSALGDALSVYRMDNRGWLPDVVPLSASDHSDPATAWFTKLMPRYVADPALLQCPSDPFRRHARSGLPPADPPDFANATSYGMSDFLLGSPGAFLMNLDGRNPPQPQATILLADVGPDSSAALLGGTSGDENPDLSDIRQGGHLLLDDGYKPGLVRGRASWLTGRHSGGIHMLAVGGGVSFVRTERQMRAPVEAWYPACHAGGCTVCRDLRIAHYSFAHASMYWWTGPAPRP